ncbi:PP2C family serine/threonine-protein phosphatase [Pseudomonas aeruginosa]|uniref:PP2C family serine/threonine-protein phosphatase n=1 Tax=Pseudomonas aeruginosa TaxID=287 RepID=UPI0024BF7CD7|nr:PP2C family serine/threonine-protein phosphatase [Pseudomonas aeruginosa]WHV79583.1 protein phosphatase 2C domain-containing protein [Pseudomonas aeruginosa]
MTSWKSFGASVPGPAHLAAGTPNQDAWTAFHRGWGDGIVVSDGLGSKPFSSIGSKAACQAVAQAAQACRSRTEADLPSLLQRITSTWLSLVAPLEPRDCAATCLFAFRAENGVIHLGMLGDGLVAAIRSNGSVMYLADDKSQGFSNITAALSHRVAERDWQVASLPEQDCLAILLCSDGVADDLEDIPGFVTGVIEAHRSLAAVTANQRLQVMLENWPTPKHSDDKTIACLCREEISHGQD